MKKGERREKRDKKKILFCTKKEKRKTRAWAITNLQKRTWEKREERRGKKKIGPEWARVSPSSPSSSREQGGERAKGEKKRARKKEQRRGREGKKGKGNRRRSLSA